MTANELRNVCLVGHGGSGKTSLVESMLFLTGATDRFGKVSDGNSVCDYDAEEIKRQISISMSMAPVNYNKVKLNVLDAPGNFDFAGEAVCAIRASRFVRKKVVFGVVFRFGRSYYRSDYRSVYNGSRSRYCLYAWR